VSNGVVNVEASNVNVEASNNGAQNELAHDRQSLDNDTSQSTANSQPDPAIQNQPEVPVQPDQPEQPEQPEKLPQVGGSTIETNHSNSVSTYTELSIETGSHSEGSSATFDQIEVEHKKIKKLKKTKKEHKSHKEHKEHKQKDGEASGIHT
jgi:hypothetical protein